MNSVRTPPSLQALWRRRVGRLALLVLVLLAVGVVSWQRLAPSLGPGQAQWPAQALPSSAHGAGELKVLAQGDIPMPDGTPAAHASSLLPMPPGHRWVMLAFWFAGTRESAEDVQIAASAFDRASQQWTPANFVVNRHDVSDQLGFGLRRLGNPVAWLDAQGRIHLFVVATGLGGWAASRILHLRQEGSVDGLDSEPVARLRMVPQRVLPLSWWWNTSHLVRAMPLPLADGGMVLPVYFELGIKYPVALRFDADGQLRGLARISDRRFLLQPTLLARSPGDWLALMRDNSPAQHIRVASTQDGGAHWEDMPDLPLANPDASVAALALGPAGRGQSLLLAYNPDAGSRARLVLSRSDDGLSWQAPLVLEAGQGRDEFSYPTLAWADGSVWISYTHQRRRIAWQRLQWSSGGTQAQEGRP